VTCGGGFNARMRMCVGPMCATPWDVEAGVCGEEECPPKAEWGEWSVCEDGWHYREKCDHNYDCEWEEEECVMPYKKVSKAEWSAWGECYYDEHLEVMVRSRDRCSSQFGCEEDVEECEEENKETPKDLGTWGQWGPCENGLKSRFKCSGVNECTEEEVEECFSNLWSSWGLCYKGFQERSKCDRATGCETELRACGGALQLESWSSWSPCVEGFSSRKRCTAEGYNCLYEDRECRYGGSEWSEWTRCKEGVREREKCTDTECELEVQDCQQLSSGHQHCTQGSFKRIGRFVELEECMQEYNARVSVSENRGTVETLDNEDWYDTRQDTGSYVDEEDTDVMWDLYEL